MTIPQFLVVAGTLMLIVLLYWQRRARRRTDEIVGLSRAGGQFHCVAIRSRGTPCAAVREFAGKRFLSGEAPDLPVPGCTAAVCRCSYVHFGDRRVGDRREIFGARRIPDDYHLRTDRRLRKDRRRNSRMRTREAH